MARILLIYPQPDTIKQSRFGFSLTLLYTSSILKNAGHTTILRDFSVEDYEDASILNEMEKADLAVVEYDAFPLKRSLNISNAGYIMELIRAHFPGKKIIAIGYDFALFPRNHEQADFTFTIEPENGITRVVSALLENKSISTSEIGVVNYLDDLPFPDRNLLSDFAQHGGSVKHKPNLEKSTLVQTSRGCSNSCVFCQRKGWLNKYREHSIEYVLREFSWLKEEEYVNVWICDDNFTLNLNRAKNILKRLFYAKLAEYMKISLSSWTKIDREFLEIAKSANVKLISFGIESANREILKFYKKKVDLDKTKELIDVADKIGIYTVGNFIIGAPMETEKTIERTFAYAQDVPFDDVNIKILDYMAGSDLYNQLPEELKKHNRHVFASRENNLTGFSLTELKEKIDAFYSSRFNKSRKVRRTIKFSRHGLPYDIRNGGR